MAKLRGIPLRNKVVIDGKTYGTYRSGWEIHCLYPPEQARYKDDAYMVDFDFRVTPEMNAKKEIMKRVMELKERNQLPDGSKLYRVEKGRY